MPTCAASATPIGSVLTNDLVNRSAADELHPQADSLLVPLSAVDVNHVRVANAGEPPGFLEKTRVGWRASRHALVAEQLEGDLALQLRVPRAVHVRGAPAPDSIEQNQPSPARTFGIIGSRAGPASSSTSDGSVR